MDSSNKDNAVRSERSNSASSAGSSPTQRRASGTLFESLTAQKRANDPAQMARRQSLHDQRPQAGFFGQWWNSYMRGAEPASK